MHFCGSQCTVDPDCKSYFVGPANGTEVCFHSKLDASDMVLPITFEGMSTETRVIHTVSRPQGGSVCECVVEENCLANCKT